MAAAALIGVLLLSAATGGAAPPENSAYEVSFRAQPGLMERLYKVDAGWPRKISCPIREKFSAIVYYLTTESPCDKLARRGLVVNYCVRLPLAEAMQRATSCSIPVLGRDRSLSSAQNLISYILIGPPDENAAAVRSIDVSYQDSLISTALEATGYPVWEYYRVDNVICMSVTHGDDVVGFLKRVGYKVPPGYKTLLASGSCSTHVHDLTGVSPPRMESP
jgi:hypothetical protein